MNRPLDGRRNLVVRMSDETHENLETIAQLNGTTPSVVVRYLISLACLGAVDLSSIKNLEKKET